MKIDNKTNERDCPNCKHHTDNGCSSWNCEFEPTTKNDLGVDLISREQAKTAIRNKFKDLPSRVEINTILNELPSVTPQEPRWIPVSKKLPDAGEYVLVTVNLGSARVVGMDMYSLVEKDGFEGYGKDVISWMPLPAPYEPQESEE